MRAARTIGEEFARLERLGEFATAHGGTAHAENVGPRGARVSVVLPRIPPVG